MASSNAHKSHTVPTLNQISKDMQGLDNPVPLSPQWLLPKLGANKAGMAQGENHMSSYTAYVDGSDVLKSPGNGEEMDEGQKKKDVFRPTFLDMESGRRDCWRDEERDINPSNCREFWREGDKEIGDNRKTDRWINSSSVKSFGEARRAPTDRWVDSSKESNYDQRRESKWNTRWGPDDREMDKWADVGKHGDMPHDKGLGHLTNHGKDEREGDHYRPWRPTTLQNRERAEPPHHQTQMAGKEGHTFGHGRGRREISPSTFSIGRGRSGFGAGSVTYSSAHSQSVGFVSNRGDNHLGEPSPFRYSRTKLLGIYRVTDVRSSNKSLDGLLQVPSLTQEEPLEPLALCAPSPEESAVMKGIENGDIASSGAPQVSKDGFTARNSMAYPPSRRTKPGSREDVSLAATDANDKVDNLKATHSKFLEGTSNENQVYDYGTNATMKSLENHHTYAANKYSEAARDDESLKKTDEVSINRDSSIRGSVSVQSGIPWQSSSVMGQAHSASHDCSDVLGRSSDIGWSQGPSNDGENGLSDPSFSLNERKWQMGEHSVLRKHPPMVADREHENRKLLQPSPEDLLLYYKDPQGQVQGPFSGTDIIGWFEAGYFGIDLQVRLSNTQNELPFSLLGDVMPHLRAKAGPPPGFNTTKLNEVTELSGRSNLSGFGKAIPGPMGIDLIGNECRHAHGSSIEAENRFLESLMSGDFSNSPLERFTSAEGLEGFLGHTSSSIPPLGAESRDTLNLLAKRVKMNLERQKSLPHPFPHWPAGDVAPVVSSSDILRDSSLPQANLFSSIADVPRQAHLQNVELMSLLQRLSDRSSGGMNSGVGVRPDLSVQRGQDPFNDKIEFHQGQNIAQAVHGLQQHKMLPQDQPSMPNLLAQTADSPNILTNQLLSPGLVQDPQVLNLLQQQYLLQLQSQQSIPGPQLSSLDKILLLNQQYKQEEQQHLLLQQQQLLSQILSEQHLVQRFGDPSLAQLQPSAKPVGNVPSDQSVPQFSHQLFQNSSQVPVSGLLDDRNADFANTPLNASQDLSHTCALESSSLHLPHKIFEAQKSWPSLAANNDNIEPVDISLSSVMMNIAPSKVMEKSPSDCTPENSASFECSEPPSTGQVLQKNSGASKHDLLAVRKTNMDSSGQAESSICEPSTRAHEDELLAPDRANDVKLMPAGSFREQPVKESSSEVPVANEAKHMEAREVKKTSDKKARKLKSSKGQASSNHIKEESKAVTLQQLKQSEAEGTNALNEPQIHVATGFTSGGISTPKIKDVSAQEEIYSLSANLHGCDLESEFKGEQEKTDSVMQQNGQVNSAHRAWKPGFCVKPKSLLEIQQEEQQRVKKETPGPGVTSSVTSTSMSTPWPGVGAYSVPLIGREVHQDGKNSESNMGELEVEIKKSQLHDLLAQEVLAKSSERESEPTHIAFSPTSLSTISTQSGALDDNFIEAKDTKKSRKKAAKAKGAGTKVSKSIYSTDVMVTSTPAEKGKTSKHFQTEEVLPNPPSGPSLGDFVPWTGESTSPCPTPAWCTDSVKFPKPTSLRDILREQEKKVTTTQQHPQMSVQKTQSAQNRAGSWSVSASSSAKTALPVQIQSQVSSLSKHKGEDDLFWGSPDPSKRDIKQVNFPQLGNHGILANKSTAAKGVPAASFGKQKSVSGRSIEHSFPSSPVLAQSWVKGKRDGSNQHSEAMDFRDWCESESVRLTGSKDTSFLEFCLKQSRSEAEVLLIENLGSFDPNHAFIEKFLNYMELLPADVLETAFQNGSDLKASKIGARDMTSDNIGFGDADRDNGVGADSSAKGVKKKGKKGKKVSPSVLGFSVVSNRIMMGEIQTVED